MIPKHIGDFIALVNIGEGSFGIVYEGICTKTKTKVGIKCINYAKYCKSKYGRAFGGKEEELIPLRAELQQESDFLHECRHKNVLKVYKFLFTANSVYIVTEFFQEGSVTGLVKRAPNYFKDFNNLRRLLDSMVGALKKLREVGIIHADIKPCNILMKGDHFVLCDFGVACEMRDKQNVKPGSPLFMPPYDERNNEKYDIWSLGVMLYILATRRDPFMRDFPHDPIIEALLGPQSTIDGQKLDSDKLHGKCLHFPSDVNIPITLKNLLIRMIEKSDNRISLEEIEKHPFMTPTEGVPHSEALA